MQILELTLIVRNLKWSVLIGRKHFTTRGASLLSLKCADFGALSDWLRAVSPPGGAMFQLCRRF